MTDTKEEGEVVIFPKVSEKFINTVQIGDVIRASALFYKQTAIVILDFDHPEED